MKQKVFLLAAICLLAVGQAKADNIATVSNDYILTDDSTGDATKKAKGVWTTSTTPALKIDGSYYHNWAAAGINQVSFIGTFNGNYKYTHPKYTWDNVVDLALGSLYQDLDGDTTQHGLGMLEDHRKNDDKIDLTSTFSMKLKGAWGLSAMANFKTQFLPGYDYKADTNYLLSSFMAPAYLTTSLAFECKKEDWNLTLSFLTGKTTFVLDEDVIAAGQLYGVDTTGGKRVYAGLGSYVKFYYKKDIAKNLNLYTRLELFYDYRKPKYHDNQMPDDLTTPEADWPYAAWGYNMASSGAPEGFWKRNLYTIGHDTDIDFELKLEYRFSSWLAAYCTSRLKYDSDFNGVATFLGHENSHWQYYQGAGVQIYFNWKTPKK